MIKQGAMTHGKPAGCGLQDNHEDTRFLEHRVQAATAAGEQFRLTACPRVPWSRVLPLCATSLLIFHILKKGCSWLGYAESASSKVSRIDLSPCADQGAAGEVKD